MRTSRGVAVAATAMLFLSGPAWAGNYGESTSWQFQDAATQANMAAVQDMIQKRKSGYYAAPNYTTNIARQYNCSVSASAAGNTGSNSTIANSPSTSGASANATGNANTTTSDGYGASGAGISGTQSNSGRVSSGVNGSTSSTVNGTAYQALNSTQTNSGSQSATIGSSNACAFTAALN